jgi:hypothetical protein
MLELELKGMKHSRGSVYAFVKKMYGLRGTKQRVYDQFKKLVDEYDLKVVRIVHTDSPDPEATAPFEDSRDEV